MNGPVDESRCKTAGLKAFGLGPEPRWLSPDSQRIWTTEDACKWLDEQEAKRRAEDDRGGEAA